MADLEHLSKRYKLNHAGSLNPCVVCRANKSTIPWTDCSTDRQACWHAHIWDAKTWAAAHNDPMALFTLPGVAIFNYIPDYMHTVHLGVYMYAFGSILEYITRNNKFGNLLNGTQKDNLDKLWQEIQQYYKAAPPNNKYVHVSVWFHVLGSR